MYNELCKIIISKGMEYAQNPEHRAQIIKITIAVFMKVISIFWNRKKSNNNEHIECNCNSCKVWKAKLEDALKKEEKEEKGEKKKIIPSIYGFVKSCIPNKVL